MKVTKFSAEHENGSEYLDSQEPNDSQPIKPFNESAFRNNLQKIKSQEKIDFQTEEVTRSELFQSFSQTLGIKTYIMTPTGSPTKANATIQESKLIEEFAEESRVRAENDYEIQSKIEASGKHPVVSGDTFSKIASKNGLSIQELQELNPTIENINIIKIGQIINIPNKNPTETGVTQQSEKPAIIVEAKVAKTTIAPAKVAIKPNTVADTKETNRLDNRLATQKEIAAQQLIYEKNLKNYTDALKGAKNYRDSITGNKADINNVIKELTDKVGACTDILSNAKKIDQLSKTLVNFTPETYQNEKVKNAIDGFKNEQKQLIATNVQLMALLDKGSITPIKMANINRISTSRVLV